MFHMNEHLKESKDSHDKTVNLAQQKSLKELANFKLKDNRKVATSTSTSLLEKSQTYGLKIASL